MSTIVENKQVDFLTQEYVPFGQLIEIMSQESSIPYSSRFSFRPYLESVSAEMGTACPNTKGILTPVLEGANNYIESDQADLDEMVKNEHFRTMVNLAVPSMFFKDDRSFIAPPFSKKFLVKTAAFEEMLSEGKWDIKIDQQKLLNNKNKSLSLAFIYILNKYYNQNIDLKHNEVISLKNRENGIERHYQIGIKLDFVKVECNGKLPELTQAQINKLITRLDDEEYVLKYLPAEQFEFSGFVIGHFYDISDIEVLSQLKHWMAVGTKDLRPEYYLEQLCHFLQSYLNQPDLHVGSIMTEYTDIHQNDTFSLTEYKDIASLLKSQDMRLGNDIYAQMVSYGALILKEDLTSLENPSFLEKRLLDNGFESVILNPIVNEEGKVISVLEIASRKRNQFNDMIVKKLIPFYNILKSGYEGYMADIDNRITGIIQKKFTSIHPSVQWKFEEVALKYLSDNIYDKKATDFDPIVFNDIYPLYAQSDIVSSTHQRNKAIQADLIENLELLSALLDKWFKKSKIHLLESYHLKVEQILMGLKEQFVSNDESRIVNLLVNEIHPLLKRLHERHATLPKKIYNQYLSTLDPELNIVYRKRKAFESSVTKLIMSISDFIEKEDEHLQNDLPHFFEKYKTDGVEYNLYLGQSILRKDQFSQDDLKNFRLWQLVNMCEVAQLVEKLSPQLEVPLQTAQLIFVYNQSLSIRFRMDEKKFDVDGAYNVRYEILKKRIDKAIIKGTDERLTVSGKIAVVYLGEKERLEYLEFFEYLKLKAYIHEEIEDLELDKLQGAEGLRALRISVKV